MRDEFKKEGSPYQNRDPSLSKKYTIFSTERLYQESKAAHFSRTITKSKFTILYTEKKILNQHDTRPIKRVHFDAEFPSFCFKYLTKVS